MIREKKQKMSVPVSVINEVKVWLNSQHIKVSIDWVEACLEFLNQECQISFESGSLQRLKNGVFEQWLAADLQEIGVPCLPSNLSVAQKTTLQGSYALQINGVRDVGKSAYSQLKQHEGTASENAEVSATPKPFQPEWEAKPTRMLMLNLTDGINYVQGMEYKPISSLSGDLPPGVKVVIRGPIDCRFGVLLLTAEKIRVLGGEVEALMGRYSKEAILREVLQVKNEVDEVAVQNGSSANQPLTRRENGNNALNNMRNTPVQHHIQPQASSSSYRSSATLGSSTIPQSHHRHKSDERVNCNLEDFDNIENIDFDNFENEEDDAFMKSIDYDALEQIEKESSSLVLPENDDFDMSEDEEVYRELMAFQENDEAEAEKYTKTLPEQSKSSMSSLNKKSSSIQNVSTPSGKVKKCDQNNSSSVNQVSSYTPSSSASFDKPTVSASNKSASSTTRISLSSVIAPKSSPSASRFSPLVNQKTSCVPSVSSLVNMQTVSTSSEYMSSHNRDSPSARLSKSSISESSVSPKTSFASSDVSSINKQPVSTLNSVSSNSPVLPQSSSLPSSVSKQIPSQGHDEDKPYSSLSSVLQNKDSSSEFTVTIKAHISATLSRLECSSTLGWQLTVQLQDGTGTVEAMIHDKVLEGFVNIPAKDMVSLQTQARSNVEIRNKVMEAVTNCKKKLQSLNCPMEIKFSPQLPKPCVIKCFL